MAKDAWKNQPNYKIGGGTINEYEFNQQHGALTEQEHAHLPGQGEGGATEVLWDETDPSASPEAQRIKRLMEEARVKAERRRRKAGGAKQGEPATPGRGGAKASGAKKSAKKSPAKESAKKPAAKGAAKGAAKPAAKKTGGAKKTGAKAGGTRQSAKGGAAAKKSSAKKSSAKKSSAQKSSAKKGGARGR
jgi:DNA end-binding protein Ku